MIYLSPKKSAQPFKAFSGKFNVRLPPALHADIASAAAASGKSLNQWIADTP